MRSNAVLDDQTVLEMQKKVKDAGYPIATMVTYSNMENYESVDSFLKECMEGKRGSVVIYEIHNDGGLGRMKFIFDGTDMYVVSTRGIRNADNKLGISYISYTRLKEWKYTKKGWFCYELCVPEPPEVVDIKENEDGTVTLTVEAVCDMVICDDAVITHELTVRFAEDGSFQYLGNEILNDGIMHIPDYQYRIKD